MSPRSPNLGLPCHHVQAAPRGKKDTRGPCAGCPTIRGKEPAIRTNLADAGRSNQGRLDIGLGASVWGTDLAQARAVALRLEAGTVWINQHGAIHPMVPFGGIKGSGWGVEFGVEGLKK